ncbi:MAG: hypothetical protein V4458_15950 [Pseudomonadota bacterium]|nr:hypothetical protein [Afipia sp.]
MSNPYWTTEGQSHQVSLDEIELLCFWALNIVGASGVLPGQIDLDDEDDAKECRSSKLYQLSQRFSEARLLDHLLKIAILVRTFDDLLRSSENKKEAYEKHRNAVGDNHYIGSLDESDLTIREACNKIIHASELRAVYDRIDDRDDWWQLTSEVELKGLIGNSEWNAVLHVFEFLEGVLELVSFDNPAQKTKRRKKSS